MRDRTPNAAFPSLLKAARDCHALLAAEDIPHVMIGGLAVCLHGHDRGAGDVDFLVCRRDWETIQRTLNSAQYVGNENRRDYSSPEGVQVDFSFGGKEPGDVRLPDPADKQMCESINGLPVLTLPELLEMKLRFGFRDLRKGGDSATQAKKHFADIVRLIESNHLIA